MSYGSKLKRELTLKLPIALNLAELALNEARIHGARSVTIPPPRALDDKTFASMEQVRKDRGAIVSLRLGGDGWSAHILDPYVEGVSAAGFLDPESAWIAVHARLTEKVRKAEEGQVARA